MYSAIAHQMHVTYNQILIRNKEVLVRGHNSLRFKETPISLYYSGTKTNLLDTTQRMF